MNPVFVSAGEVARLLPLADCIPLMREAMTALSTGRTAQSLRQIVDLGGGDAFGSMPGAMLDGVFGAKLVSVFPGNAALGRMSHQGVVVLFDRDTGEPTAIVEAGELTATRTAAASAAATDALARADASKLAILGTGEQARRHVAAMRLVRPIERVLVWGRSLEKAKALAAEMDAEGADSVEAAVRDADIVCATTGAPEPILAGLWLKRGAHVNLVGSSRAGPAEADNDLVVRARFFADHREGVLAQGAEFLNAKAAGLVGDGHVVGEIGDVFAGTLAGRQDEEQVTVYKSLGSIVQDLAAAAFVVDRLARS